MANAVVLEPSDQYAVKVGSDLIVRCENGGTIRLTVLPDAVEVLALSCVKVELHVVDGFPGVRFTTAGTWRPEA